MNSIRKHIVSTFFSIMIVAGASGDDQENVVEHLFGRQIADVKSTKSIDDDIELAKRMFKVTDHFSDSVIRSTILEKVQELTSKDAGGFDLAIQAMRQLAEQDPLKRSSYLGRIEKMRRHQYLSAKEGKIDAARRYVDALVERAENRVANEEFEEGINDYQRAVSIARYNKNDRAQSIQLAIKNARARANLMRKVHTLKGRVFADPSDSSAASLLALLYLMELQEPLLASQLTPKIKDEALVLQLNTAAKDPSAVSQKELLRLGDFYRNYFLDHEKASTNKRHILLQASRFYKNYLSAKDTSDTQRTRVLVALDQVAAELGNDFSGLNTTIANERNKGEASIPIPEVAFKGVQAYTISDRQYKRFLLAITNWAKFPDGLFKPSPNLPPIGLNGKASRTVVRIRAITGEHLYGFVALHSPSSLEKLWFALPVDNKPPDSVYVVLEDRLTGNVYKSNSIKIDRREEDSSLDRIYKSMRIVDAKSSKRIYRVGEKVLLHYALKNIGGSTLTVPIENSYSRPIHTIGVLQRWISRRGTNSTIDVIPSRIARQGSSYAAGGTIVTTGSTISVGTRLRYTRTIDTAGYPSGFYQCHIEYKKRGTSDVVQRVTVDFVLR